MAREQTDYDEAQAALQREAGVLVIDVKKAELLTQKVLKGHSVRLKVALSEWAVRTAENLQRSEVRLRDQAAAMLAIKAIGNQLYGWDREPDIQKMEPARKGGDDIPTAAVNLALINTTPEQLAALAKAKSDVEDDHDDHLDDDHTAPSATECNGQGAGPSPTALKTAPKAPQNALKHSVQASVQEPPPLSPQERRRQELEELARLRAEWRGR